jgi:hypothetical protein
LVGNDEFVFAFATRENALINKENGKGGKLRGAQINLFALAE